MVGVGRPHAGAFAPERTRIDNALGTQKVSGPIRQPLRVVVAADDAVDRRAPGALTDTERTPLAHAVPEILADALRKRASLHRREPAAGDFLYLRERTAKVRKVGVDDG